MILKIQLFNSSDKKHCNISYHFFIKKNIWISYFE